MGDELSKLLSPVSYQGAKTRIASDIVDKIDLSEGLCFYDLCCGSGAISLELVSRGYDPKQIIMVDSGPWGHFWENIGLGSFDFNLLKSYCNQIPKDLSKVKDFMHELSKQPASVDTVPVFLLLQASSFGGKAIWIDKKADKWMNCSFRSYWLPTATSKRRSAVNPMMPMPETLLKRVETIMNRMNGVAGYCSDVSNSNFSSQSIIYIDPPYKGTTQYGFGLDYLTLIKRLKQPVYCSEAVSLSKKSWLISKGRAKGGISGNRSVSAYEEWLSKFN